MWKSTIFFSIIVLLGGGYADDDDICFDGHQYQCAEQIEAVFEESPFITDEELTNSCSDIQSNLQCLENFISTCKRELLNQFLLYVTSPRAVLQDLCNPESSLREAYQEHVTCLRTVDLYNITDELDECIYSSVDAENLESIREAEDNLEDEEDVIKLGCLIYEPFISCMKQTVDDHCEVGAGQLVKDLIQRGTEVPRVKYCKHTIGSILENVADEILRKKKKK